MSASIISIIFGIIRLTILPKSLGAVAYGDYSYLTSIFTLISRFFGFRTDEAFFNYNSRNKVDHGIFVWYTRFSLINFVLLLLFILIIKLIGLKELLFPGQNYSLILLAFLFSYFQLKASDMAVGYGDSKSKTTIVQIIFTLVNSLSTIILFLLYYYEMLSIYTALFSQLCGSFIQIIILFKY